MVTQVNRCVETRYCFDVHRLNFKGYETYYHGGFWGTDVMYIPRCNMTIAVFVLEKGKRNLNATLSQKILEIINEK